MLNIVTMYIKLLLVCTLTFALAKSDSSCVGDGLLIEDIFDSKWQFWYRTVSNWSFRDQSQLSKFIHNISSSKFLCKYIVFKIIENRDENYRLVLHGILMAIVTLFGLISNFISLFSIWAAISSVWIPRTSCSPCLLRMSSKDIISSRVSTSSAVW